MKNKLEKILQNRELNLVFLILILLVVVTMRAPDFLELKNVERIVNDTAILIMVASGQFLVILTGGIDLSVGAIIAFSGMAASMVNQYNPEMPVSLILLFGILVGTALGAFNGACVAYGKIPPVITTLGTMSIFRGLTFTMSNGQWVTAHEMTNAYMDIPKGRMLLIPNLTVWAILIFIIMFYFIRFTRHGREIYAIGGNKIAAHFVGVSEKKVSFMVFTILGALCGVAGVMWTARYAAAVNETAAGFELQTIAACVLGGVSMAGGSGALTGVVLGALFLGIINNALPVVNLSPFYQMAIQGFVVLAAIVANVLMEQRNEKKILSGRRQ
ncbi:ABC transporter permease [Oceanispirochaeta sp.]|jgi:rhamnose transport system permease protein|uniref:ABC transporter permease n=1 Tax=Oceanispirochaeta sp. TaxID=2035350 RepID=UPI002634A976|nr:ABC transporter permease [Oceanispirochaeta sp.]MDA3957879.1 ABC transporter permease [Oceanispirochaeta sp.]